MKESGVLIVTVIVLALIALQGVLWSRGIAKRRRDEAAGKTTRITPGAWIVIAFVIIFFIVFVVVVPMTN